MERFAAEQPVPFSVVARLLPAGPQTARLADRKVLSASLYKLFVARELLQRVYAGRLDRAAPAAPDAGGAGRTVGQCIHDMIVVSDNGCGLWGLGLVSSYTMGGFIHLLLAVAIIAVLVRVIQGRRPI